MPPSASLQEDKTTEGTGSDYEFARTGKVATRKMPDPGRGVGYLDPPSRPRSRFHRAVSPNPCHSGSLVCHGHELSLDDLARR